MMITITHDARAGGPTLALEPEMQFEAWDGRRRCRCRSCASLPMPAWMASKSAAPCTSVGSPGSGEQLAELRHRAHQSVRDERLQELVSSVGRGLQVGRLLADDRGDSTGGQVEQVENKLIG